MRVDTGGKHLWIRRLCLFLAHLIQTFQQETRFPFAESLYSLYYISIHLRYKRLAIVNETILPDYIIKKYCKYNFNYKSDIKNWLNWKLWNITRTKRFDISSTSDKFEICNLILPCKMASTFNYIHANLVGK